jgi:hypothetical protein
MLDELGRSNTNLHAVVGGVRDGHIDGVDVTTVLTRDSQEAKEREKVGFSGFNCKDWYHLPKAGKPFRTRTPLDSCHTPGVCARCRRVTAVFILGHQNTMANGLEAQVMRPQMFFLPLTYTSCNVLRTVFLKG